MSKESIDKRVVSANADFLLRDSFFQKSQTVRAFEPNELELHSLLVGKASPPSIEPFSQSLPSRAIFVEESKELVGRARVYWSSWCERRGVCVMHHVLRKAAVFHYEKIVCVCNGGDDGRAGRADDEYFAIGIERCRCRRQFFKE